eukprot:PhF_6_TR4529/c0_g1_i1/m.6353
MDELNPVLEDALTQIAELQKTKNYPEISRVATFFLDAFHHRLAESGEEDAFSPRGVVLRQLCEIHYHRGVAHAEGLKYEEALADITKSLELGAARCLPPIEYTRRVMVRGNVNFKMGKYLEAIRDFKAAYASCPEDVSVQSVCWYNMGTICRLLPHLEAAASWFAKGMGTKLEGGGMTMFQDNFVLCAFLLRIKSVKELTDTLASIPTSVDELYVSVTRSAVVDFILRSAAEEVFRMDGNGSFDNTRYTRGMERAIPLVCDEVLRGLTSGEVKTVDDFCGVPKGLGGMLKSAVTVCVDFAMSYGATEVYQYHLSEAGEHPSTMQSTMSIRRQSVLEKPVNHADATLWDIDCLHDVIGLVYSNDLLKLSGATTLGVVNAPRTPALPTPETPQFEVCASEEDTTKPTPLLNPREMAFLRQSLPMRYRDNVWKNIYSTRAHGTSYRTLLTKCTNQQPTLFVLQDAKNRKFGAFLNTPIEMTKTYSGSGETFVWTTCEEAMTPGTHTLEVFRWSRRNKFFVHFTEEYFMVGGGGHCALRVEESLLRAETYACTTFDSPPLLDAETVEVLNVEVWNLS